MTKTFRSVIAGIVATITTAGLVATAAFFTGTSAKAASLQQITNFGTNPSNNKMYIYVPNSVKANPPILVALHQCTGTGPGFFGSTAFASLADQFGFIVIYPDANRSGQCWDVSSSQALTRNGGSDPVGIMSMVTFAEQHFNGNASKVFVTGASSGAMMTNVLLADYPDVFKAGAAFMGVPYHCFFTGTVDGWNSQCANGQVSMTPQAWGDLVRNTADPGYSGPRPRMMLWHGTADGTLNFNNFGEEIKQWTNVTGVSQTPVSTTTPKSGWTETMYGSTSNPSVEGIAISGAGHVLPQSGQGQEAMAIAFMGLNSSGGTNTVTVTNPGAQAGTVGTAFSKQLSATDSAAGQTLTWSATGLPAGLTISSSGLISGTPTANSTSSVTVTARDGTGASGSATFTFTISGGTGNTITVTNPGARTGTVGTAVSLQLSATDSAAGQTLTWSATGLPAGLTISTGGLISGTPTAAATSSVTATATDGTGASGSATFTFTISGGQSGGACHVTYTKNSEWAGGFTAQVVIQNTSTTAISSWSLTFTFPGDQKVTSNFNGGFSQSGENATLTNASYNGTIAPNSSVSVGFQGTWTSNDSSPTSFSLNGTACS